MGAIDFTYSNGCSSSPQSLHYTGNNNKGENQYTEVLRAVTTILDHYDSDKEYPFYGFGAQVAGYTQVSHCFPLNGDPKNPSIKGVDAVIEAYREILPNLRMSGPTYFAPLLRECKRQIQSQKRLKAYNILLILTDGDIHDLKETISEIASITKQNLPLSIVIVGVGNEDFSSMIRLDGDELAIQEGIPDVVQFFKYNDVIEKS